VGVGGFTVLEWLALVEHELLLFAGIFFLMGGIDEFVVDVMWLWLRLTGRAPTAEIDRKRTLGTRLTGPVAVLIPTWQEDEVIATTIAHARTVWPHSALRIYCGCYRNDPRTLAAAIRGAGADARVRIVIFDQEGPTTKADCLNRLYRALSVDEARLGTSFRMVVLHDAEDMVDPAALSLLDHAIGVHKGGADFVQVPVLPTPQPASRWIGSHYCEEFAEAHGKAMVVREALSAALPAAGVGCAFERGMLTKIAWVNGTPRAPFSPESLTEDYELGMRIKAVGGRSLPSRARRRWPACRYPGMFSGPPGFCCSTEDALDPWHRVPVLGSAWLVGAPGGIVDANARPARPAQRAGAHDGISVAGNRRHSLGGRHAGPRTALGWRRTHRFPAHGQHGELHLALGSPLRVHGARIWLARRDLGVVAHTADEHHRHHGR